MSRYGWRPHIESALRLRLADLRCALQTGSTFQCGSLQWTRGGEHFASIGYDVTLGETDVPAM
ncbi:hypothetical protein [Metallibacterium scheffleri]